MTPEQKSSILQRQERDWPKHLEGAQQGNPFATLCEHCYGRHPPPNDEICPRAKAPPTTGTVISPKGEDDT